MANYVETRSVDSPYYAHNSACAVICGWLVAFATAIVLYGLGAAIGVTALDFTNVEALGDKNFIIAALWVLVTWAVALHMGGYFAAATAHSDTPSCGAKKGVAVWALSIVITAVFGALGLGAAGLTGISAAAKVGGAVAMSAPAIAQAADKYDAPISFQSELLQGLRGDNAAPDAAGAGAGDVRNDRESIKPEVIAGTATRLLQGKDEEAKSYLAVNSTLSREEIDRAVGNLTARTEEAKAKAKAAAEKAAKYSQFALWTMFFISIIALLSAIFGGRAAARHYLIKEERTAV